MASQISDIPRMALDFSGDWFGSYEITVRSDNKAKISFIANFERTISCVSSSAKILECFELLRKRHDLPSICHIWLMTKEVSVRTTEKGLKGINVYADEYTLFIGDILIENPYLKIEFVTEPFP